MLALSLHCFGDNKVVIMGKIILIVDDEKDMHDLMKIYIAKAGLDLEIHSAFTGEEGVEMYKELLSRGKKPDVVVMDLKLPGIDGAEATERIIAMDKNATVYGFTAYFGTKQAKRLTEVGAKGVIPRPLGFDGFVEELRKILNT
ncbi:MAG: response regulator [Thermoplasmata archaeon]|jgi:CheY-like chemotaxis protein|nr:MAG: response regulator [Thermoplasmata archaeon]